MKTIVFSTKPYDRLFLEAANEEFEHELYFVEPRLSIETASLAHGFEAVCIFVNDTADAPVIARLAEVGVKLIALRCAGFNNVDLQAVEKHHLCVNRIPAYSPYSVAEYSIALLMTLNRKIHRAYNRVRESNFALNGLMGFDLHGKTVGVVGTGRIGCIAAKILKSGYDCHVLANDLFENPELVELGIDYVSLDELLRASDVIMLHCPLTPETHHLIDAAAIRKMKHGTVVINTSRGGLIDSTAMIGGLKCGKVGALGIDVYEEEEALFFEDLSEQVIRDDVFARLTTFPNVLITGHQAYFTHEAMSNIAQTTLSNIFVFETQETCENAVYCDRIRIKEKKN